MDTSARHLNIPVVCPNICLYQNYLTQISAEEENKAITNHQNLIQGNEKKLIFSFFPSADQIVSWLLLKLEHRFLTYSSSGWYRLQKTLVSLWSTLKMPFLMMKQQNLFYSKGYSALMAFSKAPIPVSGQLKYSSLKFFDCWEVFVQTCQCVIQNDKVLQFRFQAVNRHWIPIGTLHQATAS